MSNEADALLDGEFICKEDIWKAMIIGTIDNVSAGDIPKPGTSAKERKAVVWFREHKRGFVLSASCNRKFMKRHFGKVTAQWPGVVVALYVDPNVKFGKDVTGGTRICRLDMSQRDNWYSGKQPPDKSQLAALLASLEPPKPKARPKRQTDLSLVSAQFNWPGRDEWAGKPLTELDRGSLLDYRTRLNEAACLTESKSARKKLDAAVAAIDPVLASKTAEAAETVDSLTEQLGDDSEREPGQEG